MVNERQPMYSRNKSVLHYTNNSKIYTIFFTDEASRRAVIPLMPTILNAAQYDAPWLMFPSPDKTSRPMVNNLAPAGLAIDRETESIIPVPAAMKWVLYYINS